VRKGELWVTSPASVRLTTFEELPMSLARNSVSADAETALVDVGQGIRPQDYGADVKGKIVLADGPLSLVVQQAVAERGATGVISSWSVPEFDRLNRLPGDFPDQVGWARLRTGADGTLPSTFAFNITARRAAELRTLLARGPVSVRAIVETESIPGTLDVVSGIIRGTTHPEEEIVVTAHLDHYKPGANDNASGSASVLEIVRTLRRLIDEQRLPAPGRTLRFLWVPEYNGTWAWFSTHLHDRVTRVANLNFDMLGEDLRTTNGVFAVSYTPDSNPSWLNGLMESILDFMNAHNDDRYPQDKAFHIISLAGSRNRLQGRMVPYTVGTDHEIFNRLKIPGTGPGTWPDDAYHSSADRVANVDPTQLHRVVFMGLAALTSIAYADDDDGKTLAQLAGLYGKRRIAASEFEAWRSLAAATREDFHGRDRAARGLVRHVYRRESEAVRSAVIFARGAETRASIERVAASLQDEEAATLASFDKAAEERASMLGTARKADPTTSDEQLAGRLVPSRVAGQELAGFAAVERALEKRRDPAFAQVDKTFNAVAESLRRRGIGELRLMGLRDAPASYADGRRSVLEIAEAFSAEYGSVTAKDMTEYFRAYERAGVMTVK
jgi:hypothetical protein